MIRKLFLATSILVLSSTLLFGCGSKSDENVTTTEVTTEETTEATTEVATTEEVTEATTEVATTEKATEAATEATTEVATTEATTESPNDATTETIVPKTDKVLKAEGVFNGQMDSHSIEVELSNGETETFFIYNEDIAATFDDLDIGAKISFTYGPVKGQINPEILSVTVK